MNEREKDIQSLCNQVLAASLYVDSNWLASCPFCGNSGYVEDIKDIRHESECAFLIAKDLSTNITPNTSV